MHGSEQEPAAIRQAWGAARVATRGPQARLTLDEVVATALQLADQQGIDAVTLAAVARRLELTTTGLYRYLDSKDTLDELVVDAALGPVPMLAGAEPRERALAWVDALWSRYREHGWLAGMPLRRAPRCPHAYAWLDALVAELTGLGDDQPMATAVALDTLVRGCAQQAGLAAGLGPEVAAWIGERHPRLAGSGGPGLDPRDALDRAVDRLLARAT